MTSPHLLHEPAAPAPPAPVLGGSEGFLDCRNEWHAWADEEND